MSLVGILEANVAGGRVVRWPDGQPPASSYTGYMTFNDLFTGHFTFAFMNTNRVVADDTVARRVAANEAAWDRTGAYCDFGTVLLLVRTDQPDSRQFLVMDGQHRACAMRELHRRYPQRPLPFHFKATLVAGEREAAAALAHFQDSVPSDPRTFFPTLPQTSVASEVARVMRARYAPLWRARARADPPRPFMTDELLFGLLHEARVPLADPQRVLAALEAVNRTLLGWDAGRLRAGSERMRERAAQGGCMLGMLRPGRLAWAEAAGEAEAGQAGEGKSEKAGDPPQKAAEAACRPSAAPTEDRPTKKRRAEGTEEAAEEDEP